MRDRPGGRSTSGLARILVYYVLLGVALALLVRFVPAVREAFSLGRLATVKSAPETLLPSAIPPAAVIGTDSPWYGPILATISMLGSLAIMTPVTWMYMMIRRNRGYEESVVHSLLILPVAVTGIVIIVQNSIALAFSLAGIVAAVRFRTTLEDTKDAVYVFLAIGVGLASGVQALGVALTLSVMFNAVVYVLWRTRFGNRYADAYRGAGRVPLSDVLAAGAGVGTLSVGDPAILDAAGPTDMEKAVGVAARMERHVSEERGKAKRQRANTLLVAHAPAAEQAQAEIEHHLSELATRFKLAEIAPGPGSTVTLVYLARLDAPSSQGALVDRLRASAEPGVAAAELISLKGLKRRV